MASSIPAAQLRAKLQNSEVLTPDSAGFEDSLKRWNAGIEKRASIVVRAGSIEDISTTLKLRAEYGLDLAVCGGGHFAGSASSTDGGIVLSLSRLNGVQVDASKQIAIVQGGALAGDVARAAAEHGLAVVTGNVSKIGFAGATLCGGYGHLTSQFGLMTDNLLSAEVVLADGRVVTASPTENSDLFWALRGAGPLMGVVPSLTVRLHRLHNVNKVFAGALIYPLDRAAEVLRAVNETAPDPEGRGNVLLVMAAPPPTLTPVLIASVFYDGTEEEARAFLARLYDLQPQMQHAAMMPYDKAGTLVDWTADMGQRQSMGSGIYQPPLTREALEGVINIYRDFRQRAPASVNAELVFDFHNLAQVRSVSASESVFPHRGTSQNVMVGVSHLHEHDDELAKGFLQDVVEFLRERNGTVGDGDGGADQGIYTGYDSNLSDAGLVFGTDRTSRLRELKAKYDPDGVFNKWYGLNKARTAKGADGSVKI